MTVFSPDQLQKIVSETIPASVPADHTHAIVFDVDDQGAKVVASFKNVPTDSGFQWEFQAAAQHEWTGDNSLGGYVVLSW